MIGSPSSSLSSVAATLLPSSSSHPKGSSQPRRRSSATPFTGMDYLKRVFNKSQMDFQYALWQMKSLMTNPKIVYNATKTRKHIKNQWARDDPAFVVLMLSLMVASNLVHTLVFGERTLKNVVVVILETLFFDFALVSLVFSFAYWLVVNKKLLRRKSDSSAISLLSMEYNRQLSSDEMAVEWQYAFDIHCNAYFIYFLLSNVLVFLLTPILLHSSWLSLSVGNSVYLIALFFYFYISFLGYDALPMVRNTQALLYPLPAVLLVYLLLMLLNINVSHTLLKLHYGYDV